jgi:hypothetical protein
MTTRLVQLAIAVAIVAFWLHSMREALQLERAVTPKDVRVGRASYETQLARALEREPEVYHEIYQGDNHIGYSYTEARRIGVRFVVRNETSFRPVLLAVPFPTKSQSQIYIGPDFKVERFVSDVTMRGAVPLQIRVTGETPVPHSDLVVTAFVPGADAPRTLRLNRDVTLFNGLSPFVGVPQLQVGETWYLQGLDLSMLGGTPFSAEVIHPKVLTGRVVRKEPLLWEGKPMETFLAEIQGDANDPFKRRSQAWIAPDGRILVEQHRILNWTFTFKRGPVPPHLRDRPWR